jgi:hypothetical protein
MKGYLVILLAFFLGNGCDSQQLKSWEEATIHYSFFSRGHRQNIVIANGKMEVSGSKMGETYSQSRELTKDEQKVLFESAKEITLESLTKLEAPSNKHTFDGAPHASLRIVYEEKEYATPTFDHGNPPVEIAVFVEKIVALAPEK